MISAIVLAAGLSRRMGRPKLALPWGGTTVLGQVVSVLERTGLDEIVVVTGGTHALVEELLKAKPVRLCFNPQYENGEMIGSLQTGLGCLDARSLAALVVLGDQPQIQPHVVAAVLQAYRRTASGLVVPSYCNRRGHPWLVRRRLWKQILEIRGPETLREFLTRNERQIEYVPVETDTILRDLDTPADYLRERPKNDP